MNFVNIIVVNTYTTIKYCMNILVLVNVACQRTNSLIMMKSRYQMNVQRT